MATAFLCLQLLLHSKADIVWQELMDSTDGQYTGWTLKLKNESVISPGTGRDCPNGAYCWELQGDSTISYSIPTLNYTNLRLDVSVNGKGLEESSPGNPPRGGYDVCKASFTVNGGPSNGLHTWYAHQGLPDSRTIQLPFGASHSYLVGISLRMHPGNTDKGDTVRDYCYFSDIILEGDPIRSVYNDGSIQSDSWTMPLFPKLPRADHGSASGYHDHSVYLIGGRLHPYQLVEFIPETTRFIDHGEYFLNDTVYGIAQFWTQVNDLIYLVTFEGNLGYFNMTDSRYNNKPIPTNVIGNGSCIAASQEHLFIIGGSATNFSILEFATNLWLENPPSRLTVPVLRYSACVVYYNYLWTFGGSYEIGWFSYTSSVVERISVINVMQNQWSYSHPMYKNVSISHSQAVASQGNIYLIGSSGQFEVVQFEYPQIVDAVTGEVTLLFNQTWIYGVKDAAIINVNGIVYLFGGALDDAFINIVTAKWMFFQPNNTAADASINITTKGPTYTPITGNPSSFPSAVPSFYPSSNTQNTTPPTTGNPTFQSPTSQPTSSTGEPSSTPTGGPSSTPTDRPSSTPTTGEPSATPTSGPSSTPTTGKPSSTPTFYPTFSPTRLPISSTGRSDTITTEYTISITFLDCGKEDAVNACDINKTTMANEIDAILVAYIDCDTDILSTDIINNEVVIILSITMDEHNSLIGERISNRIENELEAAYGDDIDVIVKRPDDANDTEQTKENDFLGVNVIVLVVIGIAILILIAAILYCFFIGRSRHKHAQDTQSMVQKELEQDTTVANNNIVEQMDETMEQMDEQEDSIDDLYVSHNTSGGANQDTQSMVQKELEQDTTVANNNIVEQMDETMEQMDEQEDSIDDLYVSHNTSGGANQDTQSMVQKELEQDTTVANKGSETSDQVRSMINGLRKAPTDLLVTKRDLETSGVNDKVLDEIEGKEERYTHEGGTDTDEKKKEKTTT
eukprot:410000_1